MRLFKRLLSLCLCLVLGYLLLPTPQAEAAEHKQFGDLYYIVTDEGTVTITSCIPYYSAEAAMYIPETIGGLPVTEIGPYAFTGENRIDPGRICVEIPDSVIKIGEFAFWGCDYVVGLTLGKQVETIGKSAFRGCSIEELVIPASVTTLEDYSFATNTLKSVTFLGDPPNIGGGAFKSVTSGGAHTITAYYPQCNPKWTDDVLKNYGAEKINWVKSHVWDEGTTITAATCTTDGLCSYVCVGCGEIKMETIPALGHSWDDGAVTTQPTCLQPGQITYTCTGCGDSYSVEGDPATGHTYQKGVWVIEPTCLTTGKKSYTCEDCGHVKYATFATTDHSYQSTLSPAPTCTQDGVERYTCTVCGDTYSKTVSATGHNYQSTVQSATCTQPGLIVYTCTGCGDSRSTQTAPATGHSYTTVTIDPTCTQDGSITGTCDSCGDRVVEIIPATEHSYTTVTVRPTCTQDGTITSTCTGCGDKITGIIPATGHEFESGSCIHCGEAAAVSLPGDVTGDGKCNILDVARLYAHVKNTSPLEEDRLLSADITGDGKCNILDVAKLYAQITGGGSQS